MSTIQNVWQTIETHYNNGTFPTDQLEKTDVLVFSEDIENIRNGLTLMTTIAPEYLCRYLKLDGESVVLRDAGRFSATLFAERVLVEASKSESMWQALYQSGAFESMEFRALGDVAIDDLSESEKAFCVRMAKEMVLIPAGEFMMGALEDDEDAYDYEKPRHKVTLTRDFLIGKYAVTQALWDSVMGSNPSDFKGANRPVECVSWFDVVAFCNKLSKREGLDPAYTINGENVTCNWTAKGYRLPTEAEWEYSARSGQRFKYAGSDNVDEVAWYDDNSGDETHPVGQKKPNGFGLYDMSGNVWEWVWDRMEYDEDEDEIVGDSLYPSERRRDSTGPDSGSYRVFRGGSWYYIAGDARVSYRNLFDPADRNVDLGFRLSRLSP
jgi:formylglycine-generating enzyme